MKHASAKEEASSHSRGLIQLFREDQPIFDVVTSTRRDGSGVGYAVDLSLSLNVCLDHVALEQPSTFRDSANELIWRMTSNVSKLAAK